VMPVTVGRGNANEAEVNNQNRISSQEKISPSGLLMRQTTKRCYVLSCVSECGSVENLLSVKGLYEDGEDYTCSRCMGKPWKIRLQGTCFEPRRALVVPVLRVRKRFRKNFCRTACV
jgi:hypothetical protein